MAWFRCNINSTSAVADTQRAWVYAGSVLGNNGLGFRDTVSLIPIFNSDISNNALESLAVSKQRPVGASLEDVISDISVRNVEIQPVTDICLLTRYEGAYERLTEDGDNRLTEEDDVRYTESEV